MMPLVKSKRYALIPIGLTLLLASCARDKPIHLPSPVPEFDNQLTPTVVWKVPADAGTGRYYSKLQPVVYENKVITASRYGHAMAYDRTTGRRLWSQPLSDDALLKNKRHARISGGLLAAYGYIYIGSENGILFALDAKTGHIVWQQNTAGEILATPAAEQGKIVVYSSSGSLQAFDAQTGKPLWLVTDEVPPLSLRGSSKPVIDSGAVIYGKSDGKIGFVFLENGQRIRDSIVHLPRGVTDLKRISDVDATPLVYGDRFFGLSYNGQLVARELVSGNEIWRRSYSGYQDLALSGLELFLSDANSHVIALDHRNGEEKWVNKQLAYRFITAPAIMGKYIIVADQEGYLFWFDRNNGKLIAKYDLGGRGILHTPIVDEDQLFVQTRAGVLYSLKIS